ncbi:MAG: hypothetical protein ABIQ52_20950 [Vicinamibacterales bacterium]
MSDSVPDHASANAVNDAMVAAMNRRRLERQERRHGTRKPVHDRRKICAYCFQPGDHQTPTGCLRALER